tara:strand:+ start:1978 stop:2766 length:789 start_codon:yes stop_codon:yes gene_type:complete
MKLEIDSKDYFYKNNLDKLLGLEFTTRKNYSPEFVHENDGLDAYRPEFEDLVRLHYVIRKRKVLTVLEFGIGWSTLVMADALKKNFEDYSKDIKGIRRKDPFKLYSVEIEKKFMESTIKLLGDELINFVDITFTSSSITTFQGRICGKSDKLPNICPDFIYVDGPNPKSIKGSINGIEMYHQDRTNISCDLLTIEPFFLPGTLIIFDGLTNNARFHANNFQRDWYHYHNEKEDYSLFELREKPLGLYNRNQMIFQDLIKEDK